MGNVSSLLLYQIGVVLFLSLCWYSYYLQSPNGKFLPLFRRAWIYLFFLCSHDIFELWNNYGGKSGKPFNQTTLTHKDSGTNHFIFSVFIQYHKYKIQPELKSKICTIRQYRIKNSRH